MLYRTLKEGPPVYPEVMWVRMWEERHPASDKAQLPLPRAPVTHGHCVCPGQGQRELEPTLLCRLRTPQQDAGQRPPGRQAGPKCPQNTDELSSWPSAHTPPPRGVKRDGTGFAQRRRVAQAEPAAAPLNALGRDPGWHGRPASAGLPVRRTRRRMSQAGVNLV